MGIFKCTYFPKPYVVPAYIFKPLRTFKILSPWTPWLKCSSVLVFYLLTLFLHRHLHTVSKVSSPCFTLRREVSWLQNQMDPYPFFKVRWTLSLAGGVVWPGKWRTPKSTLKFMAPYCLSWASSSAVLQGWWWMSNIYRIFIELFGHSEKRWWWKMEKSWKILHCFYLEICLTNRQCTGFL